MAQPVPLHHGQATFPSGPSSNPVRASGGSSTTVDLNNNNRVPKPKKTFKQRLTKLGSSMRKKLLPGGSKKVTKSYVISASDYVGDSEKQLHSLAGSLRRSGIPVWPS